MPTILKFSHSLNGSCRLLAFGLLLILMGCTNDEAEEVVEIAELNQVPSSISITVFFGAPDICRKEAFEPYRIALRVCAEENLGKIEAMFSTQNLAHPWESESAPNPTKLVSVDSDQLQRIAFWSSGVGDYGHTLFFERIDGKWRKSSVTNWLHSWALPLPPSIR